MATLTQITATGPVRVRELGVKNAGIVWTVEPENFDRVIAMVNAHGGPDCWEIKEV